VDDNRLSIDELATAAGLTRRGIRFYVQQRLLPAPHGVGRGKHYDQSHLDRLTRIRDLQTAGHSLDEIRHLLAGRSTPTAPADRTEKGSRPLFQPAGGTEKGSRPLFQSQTLRRTPAQPLLRAELWRRLPIREGVELSFDAGRFNPTVEQLLAIRYAISAAFESPADPNSNDDV
jgi:DNA-binding transcriptional MerR regulator